MVHSHESLNLGRKWSDLVRCIQTLIWTDPCVCLVVADFYHQMTAWEHKNRALLCLIEVREP